MRGNGESGIRRTWRPPGVTDYAKDGPSEASVSVIPAIDYWQENGVVFHVAELGAENTDTGEMVYERRERVVIDNVPMFLFTGAEWAYFREHEAEVIEYLKGTSPDAA